MSDLVLGSTTVLSDSSGTPTIQSGVNFPAGHCIQMVTQTVSVETNTLTTTYTNLYEVSITLKGGNSKILILHEFNWYASSGSGIGQVVYKKTSATVTTSDTLVFDKGTGDTAGPLHYYSETGNYSTAHHHYVDDASSHNAGDTIYYGFFYRKRSGTVQLPPDNGPDGYFKTTLLEISG